MSEKRDIYAPYPVGELASNFPVYQQCPTCKHFKIKQTQYTGFKFRCYGGGENSNTAFAIAKKENYDFPQEQNNCEKYEAKGNSTGRQQAQQGSQKLTWDKKLLILGVIIAVPIAIIMTFINMIKEDPSIIVSLLVVIGIVFLVIKLKKKKK